jgi:CHAT domain-containing protein/tetratricopeptide (TPR) repeat protein
MGKRRRHRILEFFLLVALLVTGTGARAADPAELQRDAIARIDAFVDYFRKTGDYRARIADLAEAERQLRVSFDGFNGRGDFANAALSLIRLGQIQRMQGRWEAGRAYYEQAEASARKANHPAHQARSLVGRAQSEAELRNLSAAQASAERAVELASPVEDKTYLFDALDVLAQMQMKQGNFNAAADNLNRAFALPGIKDELLYYGYLDRSDVYLKLAEKCDYQRTFDVCFQALDRTRQDLRKALAIAQNLGWTGLVRQTQDFLKSADARAELIASQKRSQESLRSSKVFHPEKPSDVLVTERFVGQDLSLPPEMGQLYEQSKRFEAQAGPFGNSVAAISLHTDGLMQQSGGDHAGALASFLKAVEVLEKDRRMLQDDKARGTFLENKMGIYYSAILELLDVRRYAEAFELMERSRARAMAEMLATRELNLSGAGEQQFYAESVRLRAAIAARQADLFRLINAAAKADALAPVEREIASLEDAHRKLLARIAVEAPRLQELTTSRAISLQALQERMKQDNFEVLEYLVSDTAVNVWHIDANGVHVRNVFLPRSELFAKVEALQKSLSDRNNAFDRKTARELYLFLIQPVATSIRAERLVIVPHDALHSLPFQVLENPSDGSSLGERFQLSYAPSASIQMGLRKTSAGGKKTLLAATDPEISEGEHEVESIAKLYSGRSKLMLDSLIKESDVKASVGDYDIVHLSVHGRFNSQEPMLSYLKLAPGAQDDGRLTAAEMFGLPLAKTSMVVLSACETGKAEATRSNEVLGMLRALLYAGAGTVVLSNWEVDSASTALWMETFHRAAQANPPVEAARQALRAVKKRPEYAHPYFWSAFMLVTR